MFLDASEIGRFREEEPGYLKGVVQIFGADCHVEFIRVVTHEERDTDDWKQEAWGDNSTNDERLADLLDVVAGREVSTGAATPYTSLNGHMFSFLTETGTMALRLPTEEREAFLKKHRTRLCERYGTVMKEYVEVPHALLKKTRELQKSFAASLAYVGSLKPNRRPGTGNTPAIEGHRRASRSPASTRHLREAEDIIEFLDDHFLPCRFCGIEICATDRSCCTCNRKLYLLRIPIEMW